MRRCVFYEDQVMIVKPSKLVILKSLINKEYYFYFKIREKEQSLRREFICYKNQVMIVKHIKHIILKSSKNIEYQYTSEFYICTLTKQIWIINKWWLEVPALYSNLYWYFDIKNLKCYNLKKYFLNGLTISNGNNCTPFSSLPQWPRSPH